jgi:hypothetical protein
VWRDASCQPIIKLERPTEAWLAAEPYVGAETARKDIPRTIRLPYILKVLNSRGPALGRVLAYAAALIAGDRSHLHSEDGYLLHPDERQPRINGSLKHACGISRTAHELTALLAWREGCC